MARISLRTGLLALGACIALSGCVRAPQMNPYEAQAKLNAICEGSRDRSKCYLDNPELLEASRPARWAGGYGGIDNLMRAYEAGDRARYTDQVLRRSGAKPSW